MIKPPKITWDELPEREKDSLVAKAMGRNVLGRAWCYEGPGGWSIYEKKTNDRDALEPVELGNCICEMVEDYAVRRIGFPFPGNRVIDHYSNCLRVVENWTTDRTLYPELMKKITDLDLQLVYINQLRTTIHFNTAYTKDTESDWREFKMLNASIDHVCQAFLLAMGVLL